MRGYNNEYNNRKNEINGKKECRKIIGRERSKKKWKKWLGRRI